MTSTRVAERASVSWLCRAKNLSGKTHTVMPGIPHDKGPGGNPAGKRPVTRKMVQTRTRELALLAGRAPPHVLQADYEQAKRELTGASELDRQEAILDANDRPVRLDSAPGCAG